MTPMSASLKDWTPRQRPDRRTFEGRYVKIEPLDAAYHGDGLYAASTVPDAERLFRYLPDYPRRAVRPFSPGSTRRSAARIRFSSPSSTRRAAKSPGGRR